MVLIKRWMIGCTVIKKKNPTKPRTGLPLVVWSQTYPSALTNQFWNISVLAVMKTFPKYKEKGRGGLKVEERNKSKGWWKQASSGPQLRGQSEGSVALPTVGTQLERNVDAETPTIGALPRTSHPAALSLFLPKTQQWVGTHRLPPPPSPLNQHPRLPNTTSPYPISHSFCHSA